MMTCALYQTNTLSWIVLCQLDETTVRGQTCRPTRTHYPDSELFSLKLRGQRRSNKYQFQSVWFDRSRLEPMVYRTRGGHANHYTTDAVAQRVRCQFEIAVHNIDMSFVKRSFYLFLEQVQIIVDFPSEYSDLNRMNYYE